VADIVWTGPQPLLAERAGEVGVAVTAPLNDLRERLARLDGGGRMQVLLRLLGGEVAVSVARNVVMPAQAA
jgi:hypothetical protein